MKIVQVIHGYPMRYNAGSEVYTQTLCRALAPRHEVHVFTREADSFAPDFAPRHEVDAGDSRVKLHIVNVPRSKDRYRHAGVDQRFAELLDSVKPEVVHIGHLNHLSSSLVNEAALREIPIVFTLHDYWLMCPRGQFMQMNPENPNDLWAACDGQEDGKCARRCYARYFSGAPDLEQQDIARWQEWVGKRMSHIHEMTEMVDLFVAPSQYLLGRYRDEFGLPRTKLVYLDYGFDRARLSGRRRESGEAFTFGYIGTHIPAKGVHLLLDAFGQIPWPARLRIWGRPRGQDTEALQAMAERLPNGAASRVEWLPEYRNEDIVREVFNRVDAIVAPSIWVENSPLVIHEALQARVPVITANVGGMAEYVKHEVNGLLFKFRDVSSLAVQLQRLAGDPAIAKQLGARGYLQSADGEVPDIGQHVRDVERLYEKVIAGRNSARIKALPGPWRLTFDTNPDTCNMHCIMCEEHSPYSPFQSERKAAGKPPRVMPIELIRRVLADSAKSGLREVIPSTMGEPLLYEHFDEIVELCVYHRLKLNLTTNGTFPRRGARGWAERLVPITNDVKISINGATRETQEAVMLGFSFDEMLRNVREFIAVRNGHSATGGQYCRVTFQLTFLESNVGELADIIELAIELGVDRVKGHHLWAHFDAIKQLSMRRDKEAIRRWNAAVLRAREAAAHRLLPNGKQILLENIFMLDETATEDIAPGGVCPFLGQEAWVNTEGRFSPCCAPDAQRKKLGEFGNLNNSSVGEIWNGDAYRKLLASYSTHSLCLSCNLRKPAEAS